MLNYRKLFLAIFFLGIIVRLFTAVMLPDFMMTDTVYHLSISKNIVETGTLPLQSEELGITNLFPALFHVFIASNSILTGIAINPASTTIFAVLISLLQLLVTVILLRELFPKSWEYGAAFFTMLPLLTKFAGVNYPETLASLFVVVSFYFYVRFNKTSELKYLLIAPFSLAAMALTKLNATILLPAFVIFFTYSAWKKKTNLKSIALFIIITALLSGAWFALEFTRAGSVIASNPRDVELLVESPTWVFTPDFAVRFPGSFVSSFGEIPPAEILARPSVSKMLPFFDLINADILVFIFFMATLTLLLFAAYSIVVMVRSGAQYSHALLAILLLAFVVVIARSSQFVYARLLIPVLPLFAVFFNHGVEDLLKKLPKWGRRLFISAVVLFAFYSFFNMAFLALYYGNSFSKSEPLYEEIAKLPTDDKVIISGNQARILNWYAPTINIGPEGAFELGRGGNATEFLADKSADFIYAKLSELEITHLALVCVDDPWNWETINEMENRDMLSKTFEDGCAILYEVN